MVEKESGTESLMGRRKCKRSVVKKGLICSKKTGLIVHPKRREWDIQKREGDRDKKKRLWTRGVSNPVRGCTGRADENVPFPWVLFGGNEKKASYHQPQT